MHATVKNLLHLCSWFPLITNDHLKDVIIIVVFENSWLYIYDSVQKYVLEVSRNSQTLCHYIYIPLYERLFPHHCSQWIWFYQLTSLTSPLNRHPHSLPLAGGKRLTLDQMWVMKAFLAGSWLCCLHGEIGSGNIFLLFGTSYLPVCCGLFGENVIGIFSRIWRAPRAEFLRILLLLCIIGQGFGVSRLLLPLLDSLRHYVSLILLLCCNYLTLVFMLYAHRVVYF